MASEFDKELFNDKRPPEESNFLRQRDIYNTGLNVVTEIRACLLASLMNNNARNKNNTILRCLAFLGGLKNSRLFKEIITELDPLQREWTSK